jgi:hypothetical protein
MSDFETRKKLLVAESEVYRQLLKMEFQTFQVYAKRTKRRFTSVSSYLPLVTTGLPWLTALFVRKKKGGSSASSSLQRMASLVMLGWKTYQRFGNFFGSAKVPMQPPDKTAAEEYLSKRL